MQAPSTIDPLRKVLRPCGAAGVADAGEPPEKVARLGELQPLPAAPSGLAGWLLTLKRPLRKADELVSLLQGTGLLVLPVLLDDDGQPRFPTGELVVRFTRAVDDKALLAFARCAELVMQRRSSFTQNQAVFAPQHSDHLDVFALLEAAQKQPGVAAAWLDAQSSYQRSR